MNTFVKIILSFLFASFLFVAVKAQIPEIKLHPDGFDTIRIEIKDSVKTFYKFNYIHEWEKQNPVLKGEGVRFEKLTINSIKDIYREIEFTKRNSPWFLRDGTQENIDLTIIFKTIYRNDSLTFIYQIENIFNRRIREAGPEIFFDDETTVSPYNIEVVKSMESEVNDLAQSFFDYIQSDFTQ